MKLADWLYDNSVTPSQLRRMLGVKCRSTVWRYLTDERVPNSRTAQRIIEITGGEVQLADFLDPSPPECLVAVTDDDGEERLVLPWSPLAPAGGGNGDDDDDDSEHRRLSHPVKRALSVLDGRAWFTPSGVFLLDGKPVDLKRVMQAANDVLRRRGEPPIPYPGVEPLL